LVVDEITEVLQAKSMSAEDKRLRLAVIKGHVIGLMRRLDIGSAEYVSNLPLGNNFLKDASEIAGLCIGVAKATAVQGPAKEAASPSSVVNVHATAEAYAQARIDVAEVRLDDLIRKAESEGVDEAVLQELREFRDAVGTEPPESLKGRFQRLATSLGPYVGLLADLADIARDVL